MRRKKVLFVTNTMGQSGAELSMLELMKAIMDQCDIYLFSLIARGEIYDKLPKGVHVLNKRYSADSVMTKRGMCFIVSTLIACFFRRGTGFHCVGEMFRILKHQLHNKRLRPEKIVWRLLAEGSPRLPEHFDLAIANLEGASAYYVADAVSADRKLGFIHTPYDQAGYTADLDHNCYETFDAVFPISDSVRDAFLREYPRLQNITHVFNNLLDRDRIIALSQSGPGFQDNYHGCRLLTVSRLHPQKSLAMSIHAAALLRDRGLDFRWYVAGEGSERPALEHLIHELHLEDRFVLLGFVENPYPLFRQADIYVHMTGYEGKSRSVVEAQALMKPIIASDIQGNRELICSGENGLLVPLEPTAISDAILKLAMDRDLQLKFSQASNTVKPVSEGMEVLLSMLKE